jgi:SAM-dependent methyltransferase
MINDKMKSEWDERAATRASAMFAILDGWSGSEEAFFDRGREHVEDMMIALTEKGITIPPESIGVELGTGLGRMAIWLAKYFTYLYATDVSKSMIDKTPDIENVAFIATDTLLDVPERVDFVLSHLVLQHVPKESFYKYLSEAHEILNQGGIFCSQMHETETPVEQGDSTILVRGYTKDELRQGIDESQWEIVSLLEPYGKSEVWRWLILRKK